MKYLSVCSGIEAASVAWHSLNFEPIGFSEIEAFPAAVLAHHYPNVINYGDMTKYKEWNFELNSFDVLVGGTPCQAFSVAGLREGLNDNRGNLSLTFCELANHFGPEWVIWENVPGVFSDKTNAFGCLLAGLAGEMEAIEPPGGKWKDSGIVFGPKRSVAWRVFDAQYFGLAQRRRRVFVVASAGNVCASEVLFERQSLRRDSAPSREKGEDVAGTFAARSGISRNNHEHSVATTIQARVGQGGFDLETETPVLCFEPRSPDGHARLIGDFAPTLNRMGGGQRETCVRYAPETSACLETTSNDYSRADGFTAIVQSTIIHGTQDPCVSDIAFSQGRNNGGENVLQSGMAVRRLTPVECERLQGFPDNYTNIPWRKKDESPDGPRYKALGNSMAVPVMRWIGNKVKEVSNGRRSGPRRLSGYWGYG